eukprot:SAG22_NODE_530_length_9427_cov_3.306818_6_plen_143_part_00
MLRHSELYIFSQKGFQFSSINFATWVGSAVLHSMIIFFGTTYVLSTPDSEGRLLDLWAISNIVFTSLHVVVHVKLMVAQSSWTLPNVLVNVFSISLWFLFWPLYTQSRSVSWRANPALWVSASALDLCTNRPCDKSRRYTEI